MEFVYDLKTAHKDNRAIWGLHICHTVYNILVLLLTTFLAAYIYNFADNIFDYVLKVALYEMIAYFVAVFACFATSKIVSKTNRISIYRVSIIVSVAYLIFMVLCGENLANLIWLAGIFCGIYKGMYWGSYNVIKQEMIGKSAMKSYATYSRVFQQVVNVLFPITLGTLIEVTSFSTTSIVVLVFCLIQLVVSFLIKSKHPVNSDCDFKAFFKRLKTNNPLNQRLKFIYFIGIFFSTMTIVATLLNAITMTQFVSSMKLGFITSIISVLMIITTFIVGKFTKEGKRTGLYVLLFCSSLLSMIAYLIFPGDITIVIFNSVYNIAVVVVYIVFDIYRNKFLKEYGRYDDIGEHQAISEIILNICRTIVYGLIILIMLMKNMLAYTIMLAVCTIFSLMTVLTLLIFEKKFIEKKAE